MEQGVSDFIVVDTYNEVMEFKESDGKILVKQYSGVGTENFEVKKKCGMKLTFSFFKLNGIYYVNINGEHIMDYRKFVHITQISQLESGVRLRTLYFGDITLPNCDIHLIRRALEVMSEWMRKHKTVLGELWYYLFN
ncbi:hypothetical protein EB118_12265 [bacterium]|nr:hypothetical protein [bacterium]NDG30832.1 hypothetical protein [bacterium]